MTTLDRARPSATLVTTSVPSGHQTGPSPKGTAVATTSAFIAQHTMWMARIRILDPTAPVPDMNSDPGPPIATLERLEVGIRSDRTWRSFEWVADEWERSFVAGGARVRRWVSGNRIGDEGERTRRELTAFVDVVELAVCRTGQLRLVHVLDGARRGRSTVQGLGGGRRRHARVRSARSHDGRQRRSSRPLQVFVLPYPLETRPEEEVRAIARDHWRSFLRTIGL